MENDNLNERIAHAPAVTDAESKQERNGGLHDAACCASLLRGGRGIGLTDGGSGGRGEKSIVLRVDWDEDTGKSPWSRLVIEGKNMSTIELPYKAHVDKATLTNLINAFTMLRDQLGNHE